MEFETKNFISDEVDRRRFLKRAAVTVAWATPAIMTLTAGSAAASHNCAKEGQTCTPDEGRGHNHPKPCCPGMTCAPTRTGYRCVR